MAEGGAFDAAPPPVGGLGNFKGVMLCNRPSDEPKSHGGGDGTLPFKSMISASYSDKPGLTPCKNFEPTVKKRGSSAALRRHVQWLKELQEQMRGEREQYEEEEVQSEERRKRMQAFFDKHREGVRQMLAERDAKGPLRDGSEAKAVPKPAPAKSAPSKPLWAMTAQEKEDYEEGDADSLINFAENLDYEKFIGDLDFKQGMEALKDRAGKLQKEQTAFKDSLVQSFNQMEDDEEGRSTSVGSPRALEGDGVEGQSILGDLRSEYSVGTSRRSMGAERYGADGRPEWDGSTALGDNDQVDRELKAAADVVLESNPQMRAIHSKESVQKIIERAKEKVPESLAEAMQSGAVAAPVITQSEDTQNKLHKIVDPSSLPYLYRSPAV